MHQIGDVPIASIQSITFTNSKEKTEIDLLDKNDNFVLNGSDQAREVELEFTLVKQSHPEQLGAEEQRLEVKGLASNDAVDNYFEYDDSKYFLAIGDISIPESGSMTTIREGTLTAKVLPWPKHFPDAGRGVQKRMGSDTILELDIDSDIVKIVRAEGEADYNLDVQANWGDGVYNDGQIQLGLELDGDVNAEAIFVGDVEILLDFDSNLSTLVSNSGEVGFEFEMEQLDIENGFGREFGTTFGSSGAEKNIPLNVFPSLVSDIDTNLNISGYLNGVPVEGDTIVQLDVSGDQVPVQKTEGSFDVRLVVDGNNSKVISTDSSVDYQIVVEGELTVSEGYGVSQYGINYGG